MFKNVPPPCRFYLGVRDVKIGFFLHDMIHISYQSMHELPNTVQRVYVPFLNLPIYLKTTTYLREEGRREDL